MLHLHAAEVPAATWQTLGPEKLMDVANTSGADEGWERKEQATPLPGMIYLALKECFYFENTLGSLHRTKERE